jgi:hypothetical protein
MRDAVVILPYTLLIGFHCTLAYGIGAICVWSTLALFRTFVATIWKTQLTLALPLAGHSGLIAEDAIHRAPPDAECLRDLRRADPLPMRTSAALGAGPIGTQELIFYLRVANAGSVTTVSHVVV